MNALLSCALVVALSATLGAGASPSTVAPDLGARSAAATDAVVRATPAVAPRASTEPAPEVTRVEHEVVLADEPAPAPGTDAPDTAPDGAAPDGAAPDGPLPDADARTSEPAPDTADGTDPVPDGRVASEVIEAETFQTLGVTWPVGASVSTLAPEVRTRTDGAWTAWSALDDDATSPDPGTPDAEHEVRSGTPTVWVGEADAVQLSFDEAGSEVLDDVRAVTLASEPVPAAAPVDAADASQARSSGEATIRTAALTSPALTTPALVLPAAAGDAPRIITRQEWGARGQSCTPDVARRLVAATVHHTAGSTAYATPQDAMAQIRNDQAYHMDSRGWCDLGYNFIVDKWGHIYEGRGGSITQPVIGVHAGGFNTGTVGISMLGTFTTSAPPAAMIDAVARIAGYRLAAYGVEPLATMNYTTAGGENSRYPAGSTVTLHHIFAHRETGFTTCPGDAGYAMMPRIRDLASAYAAQYGPTGVGYNLVRTPQSADVYLITDTAKHRVTDVHVLDALSVLGPVGVVDRSVLDVRTTGTEIGRFVRDDEGRISLVDRGTLYPVRDCAQLDAWGARCDSYGTMTLLDAQIGRFARGQALSRAMVSPSGVYYLVDRGRRLEIADNESLVASGMSSDGPAVPLSQAVADALPYGPPLVRTGIAVQDRGTGRAVLLDRAAGLALSPAWASVTMLARATTVRGLDPGSMAALPAARAEVTGVLRAADGRRFALTMGGAVWLASGQFADDAGTPVDDAGVAALRPAAAGGALFVRSVGGNDLFYVDGTTKRPVASMDAAYATASGGTLTIAVVRQSSVDALRTGAPLLTPGRLVKAVGAAPVYLVDGAAALVHVPSFDVVRALGLSTAYTEVPASTVAGYAVASRQLGTLVSCAGQVRVGTDGRALPVSVGLAAGSAPATPLAASTCALLPGGGELAAPVFVQAVGSPSLFLLDAGTRRPVTSMDTVYRLAAGSRLVIAVVAPAALDAVPVGAPLLTPGQLVKAVGAPAVHLVDGTGTLVHVPSFDVVQTVGLGTAYVEVPASALVGYSAASRPLGTLWSCAGQVRVGAGGRALPVPSLALAAGAAPATPLAASTCAAVPGGPAFGGPVFVQATGSASLFLLQNGTRRPVSSMDTVYRLAGGSGLVIASVSKAALDAVPVGAAV